MKNIVKKIGALVLVWVVCLATLSPAYAAKADLPELPKDQCVVDEANVLSSSTVQTITDLNAQLQSSCKGATIGVLTVDYTGSCTTEEYALQAANAWGIGSSTGNNGVPVLRRNDQFVPRLGVYRKRFQNGAVGITSLKHKQSVSLKHLIDLRIRYVSSRHNAVVMAGGLFKLSIRCSRTYDDQIIPQAKLLKSRNILLESDSLEEGIKGLLPVIIWIS